MFQEDFSFLILKLSFESLTEQQPDPYCVVAVGLEHLNEAVAYAKQAFCNSGTQPVVSMESTVG